MCSGSGRAWRRRLRRRGLMGARTVGSISGCRIPTTTGPRSPGPRWCAATSTTPTARPITIGGKEFNRNEEYHSASTPELSIVSKLRVEVGCDAAGANCAHSLDSTPGSFKPYYRSYSTGRYDGADTEALLAPANYCTDCWGNARGHWLAGYRGGPPHLPDPHDRGQDLYLRRDVPQVGDDLGRVARRQTLLFARRVPHQPVYEEQRRRARGRLRLPGPARTRLAGHPRGRRTRGYGDYQRFGGIFVFESVEEYFQTITQS